MSFSSTMQPVSAQIPSNAQTFYVRYLMAVLIDLAVLNRQPQCPLYCEANSATMEALMPKTPRAPALLTTVVISLMAWATASAQDAPSPWPRKIEVAEGEFTIYQPQPESFNGNTLTGRAAGSLKQRGEQRTFGVFWFTARVDTDRDAGEAVLRDIVVTDVRWPDSEPEKEQEVAGILTGLMPDASVPISLERLTASLATAELERQSIDELKHDPPEIVIVEELAQLLLYDGEPRGIPIPDSALEHIANSTLAVVHDTRSDTLYMNGGAFWYSASDPKGPWTSIDSPPADIAMLFPPAPYDGPTPDTPPRIVVATVPTELISIAGTPDWQPLGAADLLYVANTETPVVRVVESGQVLVLLAGRWFEAATLEGPWSVVRPDELPAAFSDIPPASALGAVRVSVAGTPEAEDAVLDTYIPQTAAIDRSQTTLEVVYDGRPEWEAIEDTGIEYAVNTASSVLRIDRMYYACDEGVWFVAEEAEGPWIVADEIPDAIAEIPPSSPVFNVTHVHVYESTPDVVYVGYTSGYLWSYPWYGVPIYGTGWYYPPYWGRYYYPHAAPTWGMHLTYNPYTGWGMGVSYSFGFLTVGIGFGGGYGGYYRPGYPPPGYYRPPYYPPGGYRPPYYPPNYRPGTPRPTPYADARPAAGQLPAGAIRPSAGQLPASGARPGAGQLPSTGQLAAGAGNNLYNGAGVSDRLATPGTQQLGQRQSINDSARGSNNIYAGGDGSVHRQTSGGWQSRDNGSWGNRTQTAPSNLNRDFGARQMGGSFGGGRSMGGGGMGMGGGRRR